MINNIFKKIYKHKRYLPMQESLNYNINGKTIVDTLSSFLEEIQEYIGNNSKVNMAINGSRFIFYKSFGVYNIPNNINDIENIIKNKASEIYKQNGISNNNIILYKIGNYSGNIINICPFIRTVFDNVSFKRWEELSVFYKISKTEINDTYINQLYKKLYVRQYDYENIEDEMYELMSSYFDIINDQDSENESEQISKYLNITDISNDTSANENPTITLATDKNGKNVIFRLYTKQLITDSKPRTLDNCASMILNNCQKLEEKLSSSNKIEKLSALNFGFDDTVNNEIFQISESSRGRPKKNILDKKNIPSAIQIMKQNSGEQNKQLIDKSIQLVKVYKEAIINAKNNDFKSDYKNSKGLNNDIQVYLPEILSPYVLCSNACEWTSLGDISGYKALQEVIGNTGNDFLNNECYIGYYDLSIAPLADSYVWIDGKFIDISTKAGLNGKGAAASIESLRKYIFKTDKQGNLTNELSFKGKSIKAYYPAEFKIFDHLSTNKNASIESVKKIIEDNVYGYEISLKSNKQMNDLLQHKLKFSDFIMEILQSTSYDFVQMNCKPTSNNNDFHFTYKCQYPAVFDGKVEIIFTKSGFTKFHIV